MVSLYFLDNDNLDTQSIDFILTTARPPPFLSLLFLSSLSSNQRFCNVYSQAAHFRSGFSGGEIHDLRRLRREGFPERLSRS